MSRRLFATSSTQAFGTRLVTSGTWSSATARPGRRSESRSGRARLTERGATRRHDRSVLASSRQPVGPCNRLRVTTSSSLTSGSSGPRPLAPTPRDTAWAMSQENETRLSRSGTDVLPEPHRLASAGVQVNETDEPSTDHRVHLAARNGVDNAGGPGGHQGPTLSGRAVRRPQPRWRGDRSRDPLQEQAEQ